MANNQRDLEQGLHRTTLSRQPRMDSPEAKHQLCVFHVISEVDDHVLDTAREVQLPMQVDLDGR